MTITPDQLARLDELIMGTSTTWANLQPWADTDLQILWVNICTAQMEWDLLAHSLLSAVDIVEQGGLPTEDLFTALDHARTTMTTLATSIGSRHQSLASLDAVNSSSTTNLCTLLADLIALTKSHIVQESAAVGPRRQEALQVIERAATIGSGDDLYAPLRTAAADLRRTISTDGPLDPTSISLIAGEHPLARILRLNDQCSTLADAEYDELAVAMEVAWGRAITRTAGRGALPGSPPRLVPSPSSNATPAPRDQEPSERPTAAIPSTADADDATPSPDVLKDDTVTPATQIASDTTTTEDTP